MNNIQGIINRERICIIIPTYNNEGTITDILRRIMKYTKNIIIINDGCTDHTKEILEKLNDPNIIIINNKRNRGKGISLKEGFKAAIYHGYEYAITIDANRQHFPEDIPLFIETFLKNKGAIIIGERTLNLGITRQGNNFTTKFSDFWFHLQTGIKMKDTQCGYRLYPLTLSHSGMIITSRYESELEFLVFSAWRNIPIVSVPVHIYYPPKEKEISHFRPFYDFLRISLLNTILTIAAMLYFIPKRKIKRYKL